jgi:predicted Zn-dependent protease
MAGQIRSWFFATLILLVSAPIAFAQTILRDAEMERALRELARPVLSAAGLSPARVNILVLRNDSLNAFVVDANTIFIHSGLLLKMNRPAMLQAVIAHEAAHIANGHLTRRAVNRRTSRNVAVLGTILSLAAAGASPEAAGAIAIGTASSAERVFLGHTRAEESSADQAGIRYLARSNIDPSAMVDVMQIFVGQEALNTSRQDPYVRSHPLSRERVRAIKGYAAAYKETDEASAESVYWYNRVQRKLSAYLRAPSYTLRRIKKSDQSDSALVARALAHHKNSNTKKALNEINTLLNKRPRDAYAHELKGQILLESRQFGAAVKSYNTASSLAPKEPLILAGYGQALLAAGNSKSALGVLQKARARDVYNPRLLRDLSVAYAKTGNNGMASLSTAERYAIVGRLPDAGIHAKRALGLLPRGSASWQRAQDIADASDRTKKRKKRK